MDKHNSSLLRQRNYSPFDDSAMERQRRMGLVLFDGKADRNAMSAFSRVFAGQFFDSLCDYYQDLETVRSTSERLLEVSHGVEAKKKFLAICLEYDSIYRTLPDPVWWISGNLELVALFTDGFLAHLRELTKDI